MVNVNSWKPFFRHTKMYATWS